MACTMFAFAYTRTQPPGRILGLAHRLERAEPRAVFVAAVRMRALAVHAVRTIGVMNAGDALTRQGVAQARLA